MFVVIRVAVVAFIEQPLGLQSMVCMQGHNDRVLCQVLSNPPVCVVPAVALVASTVFVVLTHLPTCARSGGARGRWR
jgi:hypothetical protein